ncbi:MAG: type II secretion system protein [Desulfovibrionaceae bacterium]
MRGNSGFTLIELVATVVILSVVALITSLFLVMGVESYVVAADTARSAQAAHNALDRISLELKSARGLPGTSQVSLTANSVFSYSSMDPNLPGTRALRQANGSLFLSINNVNYLLLENVNAFVLNVEQNDMDGDAANQEISSINISFRLDGAATTYSLSVTPRTFIRL